jgi:hypothetical protein
MRNQQSDDDVRALVRTAQLRARTLGHPGLGSEHLLYAVAHSPTRVGVVAREHGLTPEGVAAQIERLLSRPRSVFDTLDADALATIGIDLHEVRDAVQASFGPGPLSSPGPGAGGGCGWSDTCTSSTAPCFHAGHGLIDRACTPVSTRPPA